MKSHETTVVKNFSFLFLNQFSNLIIPLLVFPFLVKTLGLNLYGLYSITYSAMLYCFMFCDYGFNFSGSKYIAINRLDAKKRDTAFSTIVSLKIVIGIIVSLFWIGFIFYDPRFQDYRFFGLLFVGMIIGNAINTQWFFQGIEQLGWYSTVNAVVKLLSNVLILVFIKSKADIYLIPLLYSGAYLVTGIITIGMAVYSSKVRFRFLSFESFRFFVKEGFDNFVTISTTSLVFNGTIIILSFFEKSVLIIGIFSTLDRIVKIMVSVYVPYSTAIYPRNMANFQVSVDHGKKSVLKYGVVALAFASLCIAAIFLLADVILAYLNPELVPYSNWLRLFSVWLFFIIVNNLLGYHYMNGLNVSSVFRNINLVYTAVTVALMVAGCYLYSFRGCITAVLAGEIFLTIMLVAWYRSSKTLRSNITAIN